MKDTISMEIENGVGTVYINGERIERVYSVGLVGRNVEIAVHDPKIEINGKAYRVENGKMYEA